MPLSALIMGRSLIHSDLQYVMRYLSERLLSDDVKLVERYNGGNGMMTDERTSQACSYMRLRSIAVVSTVSPSDIHARSGTPPRRPYGVL